MANNDFINSVIDSMADEGAAAPAPAPQQGGFNPVIEAAVEEVGNVYKAREYAAALQSLSSDPDKYAEYMKLGDKTGFDPAFVGRNYEAISRDAALDDITKLIGYNQKLGQWYVEGDNPNAIKVDELRHLSGLSWLGASAVQSFKSGRNTTALADLRFKDLMGTATGEEMSEITRLNENREPRTYGADTSFQRGWSGAFQQIPIMAETAVGSIVGAAAGGAAGAGTALVAGQLGPQVAVPEELITVPGAAAWGARAGWITGGVYSSFRQQTGLAFDEFVQLKDETGQPLDRDVARIAALAAGGVGAGLEFVGFQSMAKIVPGMDKVMGSLSSEGVKAALMRPTIRAAFKNFAMNVGKSMTTETITEVAQEAMTMLAGELAKEASGQAFAPMSLGDAHERISETFVQTLETMAVMGPFLSSTRFGSDISRAKQATRNQAVISQIIDSAKRDELLARLPEKSQAAVKAMAEGGDMENVFIDPAVVKEYFQDPNDLREFIDDLDIADEFRDAEVIGRDVQIPIEVYYAKIAATNFGVDTQKHVKFSPEDMSSHVADVFNAAWAETQSALMDEVQRREREEYGPKNAVELIHQDVKSRLMNAGNTPDHSERIALMYSTFFRVLSKDTGQDAGDLYAKYGLDFRRVMPGDNMRGVDALSFALEKIRRGHVPAMAKALQKSKGPSMLDAIKKRGGVIDTGGELAAMGANKYIRQAGDQSTGNMFGKGDNKFGADETLLSLWEDGYFPEFQERPDLNVLYDAMAEELAGTPRYSVNMDASGDKRMQNLADIIALSEDLQRLGLDPSTMSDDEIITELDAITNTDPDTAALYQRVKSLPSSQSLSTPKVPTAEEMESLSRVEDVPLVDARGTNRLDWEAFDAGEHPGDLIDGFGDMPVVGRREDGEYIVFDGHHRIALAIEAGETAMPMHVIDVKAYDPANAGRVSTPNDFDIEALYREFFQEDGPDGSAFEKWFGDSKVVDEDGKPMMVYHGTGANIDDDFAFDPKYIGATGAAEGYGFYFTTDKATAEGYQGRDGGSLTQVYLSIKKPMPVNHKGFSAHQLGKIIDRMIDAEISLGETDDYKDTFVSNYVDTYSVSRATAVREVARIVFDSSDSAIDQIAELGNVSGDKVATHAAVLDVTGFDGIVSDGYGGQGQAGGTIYVAWFPEQIKSVNNVGSYNQNDPRIMYQGDEDGPETTKRGSIQFYDGRTIINTFEHANLSTLLHETGHFFLEVYRDAILKDREAGPDNVNAGLQERWAKLAEFLDIKDEWNIGRDSHEKFARSFETYLFEGKAPSNEVAGFMARFRSWLTFVYKTAKAIGAPINDEIRAVFDRMLATDDEIKAAQFSPNFTPAFKSEADALAAGMTEAQWRDYKEAANNAVDRTREIMTARMLDDVRQQTTKEYREARKAIRDQVEARLRNQPIYQAINYLKGGKIEGPLADLDRMFLDKEAVEDIMGDGAVFKLPRSVPPVYRAKGGVHPDIIAELFGFKSGHDLLKSMLSAEPIARAINNETDALMKEKFGDLLGDTVGRIREAQNAIANDATGELLNREMEVFMKKGLVTSRVRMADAKRIATEAIRSKPVREAIRVKLYQNATLKAAEEAQRAVMAGKWKDAVAAKQRQILSHYMTQAALQVDKDTQSAVNYLNRFAGRSRPKNIDPEYLDQIEQLLERFDMRKAVSLKQAQRRASLASWIEAQEAAGNIVTLPDAVRRDAFRKPYKEMTVEDLMTVRDAVQNIEHLGRLKSKLLANKERREYQDAVDSLTASVAASKKRRKMPDTITPTKKDGFFSWARSMESTLVKIEQFFEFMDNGDINGPFRRLIWRPIAEAQQREIDMLADYTGRIFKTFEKLDKKRLAERITIEGVDRTFQRHNIMAVALNMGSESNLDKMLRGEGWNKNPEILDRIVSHLNDAEWAAVQEVWDTINSLWPEIKAVQKRLTGVEPPKVESRKFTTPTGRVLTGGYYPMMYDPDRVDASTAEGKAVIRAAAESDRRVAANDVVQFENVYLRPETRHGFTKERAQEYTMPILFSVDGIARHINAVIHDVTHREALIDANKLLTNPFLRAEISSRYGKEMYDQIVPWLQNIAHDAYKRDGLGAVERFMRGARTHATIVAMGFRISTGIMQLSGFGPSLEVLIPSGSKGLGDTARAAKAMAGAMKDFLVSPMATWDEIVGKSTELRSRSQTLDRDIRQALNDLTGRTDIIGKAQRFSMYHIGYMDRVVSAPTWLAAYRLHLQQYPTDEMGAREAGDRAVRMSQGAGGAKDLAAVQRSNELVKMLTMFYSYFSAYYNRQKAWGRDAKRALASGEMQEFPALLARQIAMTIVPAVLGDMLVGRGPDDDQSWLEWAVKKSILYPFSAVPIARDMVPVVFGESFGDYTLSPVERTFNDGVVKPLQLIGDILDDETEVSGRKATRTVLNSAGLLIGLPTGQLSTTVNNVWLGLEQDDFQFRDLVLSRPEKR